MLYFIVRPIARIAFGTYFRKIFLSGIENIPKDAGVILAANHPTAFIEPCVLACWLDRPLYFLVRGGLFSKPFYARLMRDLHMLPIFRQYESGIQAVRDNYKVLDAMSQALGEGKTVMILAEGNTRHEKRLRPIRKAVARLAFNAASQFPDKEIYVVPVGVNYTYSERFRSEVMIEFSEPMRLSEYRKLYEEKPPRALREFTQELAERLAEKVVIIERKEDEELVERLFVMHRTERQDEPLWPVSLSDDSRFRMEKAIADAVNEMDEERKKQLKEKVDAYWKALAVSGLNDRAVYRKRSLHIGHWLFLILGFVPFVLGYLLNYFILWAAHKLSLSKVERIEFQASVAIGVGMGFYLIYLILLMVLGGLLWGWKGVLAAFVVPLLGFFALFYWEKKRAWLQWASAKTVPQELKHLRTAAMEFFRPNVAN